MDRSIYVNIIDLISSNQKREEIMAASHYPASQLAALGREWVEAWNSRDLERVLTLYAEDTEMTSDRIPAMGFDASGTLRGKDNLRAYWSKALALIPNLHFTLIDTYVSPDSVVVFYENERGKKICEYLRLDADGKIRQGSANHLPH
jgi:ketosteroid isomerase-like protein